MMKFIESFKFCILLINVIITFSREDTNISKPLIYLYLQISQTGGSWLRHQIPVLLRLSSCNNVFHLPDSGSFRSNTYGKAPNLQKIKHPVYGQICSYFNYQFQRPVMNSSLSAIGYPSSSYLTVSSFDEPCSHFFRSFEHANKFGIGVKLSQYIADIQQNHPKHYDLRNFQIKYMVNDGRNINFKDGVAYMKSLFWFSIVDELELSLRLLQCQVLGKVDEPTIRQALNHDEYHRIKSKKIKVCSDDIKKLNSIDFLFYEFVKAEFWDRIYKYADCLNLNQQIRKNISKKKPQVKIQKVINKVYFSNSGNFDTMIPEIIAAHDTWTLKNHGYVINYYNLKQARAYIAANSSEQNLKAFDCIKSFAGKANLFRYILVYNEGGWYSDWKQVCLKQNLLDSFGNDSLVFFYSKTAHGCVQNAIFGATKEHDMLRQLINLTVTNINNKRYGPDQLSAGGSVCAIGKIFYKNNITFQGYYFDVHHAGNFFDNKDQKIVQHKCINCGSLLNWPNGNDYGVLWHKKQLYC